MLNFKNQTPVRRLIDQRIQDKLYEQEAQRSMRNLTAMAEELRAQRQDIWQQAGKQIRRGERDKALELLRKMYKIERQLDELEDKNWQLNNALRTSKIQAHNRALSGAISSLNGPATDADNSKLKRLLPGFRMPIAAQAETNSHRFEPYLEDASSDYLEQRLETLATEMAADMYSHSGNLSLSAESNQSIADGRKALHKIMGDKS